MATHDHLLILKSASNVTGRRSRHLYPCLGKEGTGSKNECQVDDKVERVTEGIV